MKKNYYTVNIPLDFTNKEKEACSQAIEEAKERTRVYFMPCEWTAKCIRKTGSDYVIRVCRRHN